jgi:SdpC family antimicrobial peptide
MKNKILISSLVVLLLAFAFSCNSEEDDKPLQNYSGEELFQALFFSSGEAAQHIQTIQSSVEKLNTALKANPEVKKFTTDFSAEIIQRINELDPTYFTRFKEQLASDNFYTMELALANGSKMIKAAGYRSSYAGMFRLMDDLNEKNVDFSAAQLEDLDYTKEEDVQKLKDFLSQQYSIDLNSEDYKVACVPVAAVCVVYAIAAVVSISAAAYTALAVVNAAAWITVYAWIELWGGDSMMETVGQNDVLIQELSVLL